MKIVESILTKNDCYKGGRKIVPMGIMLHSVGCAQPKASVFINSWNKAGVEKCVHAFIDGNDGTVYQTLPWGHRGWHAGTGTTGASANNSHIGVEMCEPSGIKYTSGARFTVIDEVEAIRSVAVTYTAAVELFAKLCSDYGFNPYKDIISHSEGYKQGIASNHGDPVHLWTGLGTGYTMDKFRETVAMKMESLLLDEKSGAKPAVYNTFEEVPNFAKEAVQFYIDKNALRGDDSGLNLSYEMLRLLVITYRAYGK